MKKQNEKRRERLQKQVNVRRMDRQSRKIIGFQEKLAELEARIAELEKKGP